MYSTNYHNTLITVSSDCPVSVSTPPSKKGSIAELQFSKLYAAPYCMTSDELLFAVEIERNGDVSAEEYFAKPKACLRASPLVKKHGFGLHHDSNGRVALVPMESSAYAELEQDTSVIKRAGIRSNRR